MVAPVFPALTMAQARPSRTASAARTSDESFMVRTDDRYWQQIVSEKTVAIYLPPPFDPSKAKITLMGIPDRA